MHENYVETAKENAANIGNLRKQLPDVMNAFGSLSLAVNKQGALDKKTKELITIALSVAARCDGCISMHIQALVKLGATKEELVEALGMAIYMGGGPSVVYAAAALKAFEDFQSS